MRRICWDQRLVRQLFTTEADTKLSRDSFLRLHQPFDRIRVVSAKPYVFSPERLVCEGDELFIAEEALLNAIQTAPTSDPNRIFVLTGEPGSGKSHLARWLYVMLQDQSDRFPIHIPRRINSLVGVLKQLVTIAGLKLEEDPSGYLAEAPVMKVVRYLLAYLDMSAGVGTAVGHRLPLLSRVISRPEFETILARQIARYQASRANSSTDGPDLVVIPEEDFGRLAPGGTLAERTEAYSMLRRHLTEAMRKVSNLDRLDLKGELERISRTLVAGGRRPVLILEDITSFDLLHDDLLTFLLDESAGHFDALVCWTTGYEKAYLRTYQLDRYTARLSLSSADMEVYSLQGDGFKRLVKGYLDVVKPWCKPGLCDLYEQCVPAFEGLYPFNPESLERIYDNLLGSDLQQRKTPRNLLDRAVKSYLELAEGHGSFPPLHQPPVVKDILYPDPLFRLRESHPAFVALTGWYGQSDGETIRLNSEVPRLLGVNAPSEYLQGGQVAFPIGVASPPPEAQCALAPATNSSYRTDSMTSPEVPKDTARQVEVSNRLKELRLEIQSWMASLKVPAHDHELLRGVHKLFGVFKLRLPVPLGHPAGPLAGLTYGKAQGESNLTVAGTRGKTAPQIQLMIVPSDPAALGCEEAIWHAALQLQLAGQLPENADLALLSHWCHTRHQAYRKHAADRLEATLGMSLERWVLAARWMLLGIRTGLTECAYSHLIGAEVLDPLPEDLMPSMLEAPEVERVSVQVDRLFSACFTVASGVYDSPRIMKLLEGTTPHQFLSGLANVAHTKLDPDYRIGMTTPFRDVVRAIKHLAAALVQGDSGVVRGRAEAEITLAAAAAREDPEGILACMDNLRRLIGLTGRYDLFDPQAGEIFDQQRDSLASVDQSLPLIEEALRLQSSTLWEYLKFARRVAQVRQATGYPAALAAARWAVHLQERMDLPVGHGVIPTLEGAAQCLHQVVRRSRSTIEQALHLLEELCRENQTDDVHSALRLLRNQLLA